MRVAVFGAGGVGGYLGARLADAGAAEVHLIARGPHLEALQERGLELRSIDGGCHVDVPVTDGPAEVGPVDVVVFTVKSNDTRSAAASLGPMLDAHTAVVSFQNGVDNESWIADEVGEDHVLGGVAYIFATIAEPGVVDHTGGPSRFVFGELDGTKSDRAVAFLEACQGAGIDTELSEDVRVVLWRKFVLMCCVGGMTAATRLPLGAIRDDPDAWAMFERIAQEVNAVAAVEDVGLPEDIVDRTLELTQGLGADSYSSLYYDLTHGKPLELEALNGAVVRRGREHDVAVPMNEAIVGLLSPWAARNASASGGGA